MFEKRVMEIFYGKAEIPEDLPWHNADPHDFVAEAADSRGNSGKVLDLGCGTGVISVYLAVRGFEVTALDFIPKALVMAEERAKINNVDINFVECDLLEWQSDIKFDLIHDSGTLHSIPSSQMPKYKQQLISWSNDDAEYVLAHWGRRNFFDWRPIGPHRRNHDQLTSFFAPEFREKGYSSAPMSNIPLFFGPTVLGQSFWFKRA